MCWKPQDADIHVIHECELEDYSGCLSEAGFLCATCLLVLCEMKNKTFRISRMDHVLSLPGGTHALNVICTHHHC